MSRQRRGYWEGLSQALRRSVELFDVLLILLLASSAQAQETAKPEDVGVVVNISGIWLLDGPPPERILLGQVLPAAGRVLPPSPKTKSSYIELLLLDGRPIRRWCIKPGDCDQPISLPASIHPESSLGHRIIVAVKEILTRKPGRTVPALSRGGGGLQDTVVKRTDGYIDLSPVFKQMEKNFYRLQFRTIPRVGAAGNQVSRRPVDFHWDPTHSSLLLLNELEPGLYELALMEMHSKPSEPTGIEAWILVSEPEAYEKNAAAFQEAVELTAQWSQELKPESIRGFLQAYLEFLAEQGPLVTPPHIR